MSILTTEAELDDLYGVPSENALVKVTATLIAPYRALIAASPFAILATVGPDGVDASPRGDEPGFVVVRDERTLLLADRSGNNRVDSLRNIVRDPRVALLFLIPGSGTMLRVNGRAVVETDLELRASFPGPTPRTVIVATVESAYFHCSRAVTKARLWDPSACVDRSTLPTAGAMLAHASHNRLDGEAYDRRWPDLASPALA
ncbi:MAG: pyridoxamine 5'-phosphate oxidase family protein [Vulcanimicrobiaceae bacterium]